MSPLLSDPLRMLRDLGIAVPPDRPITVDGFMKLPEGPPWYELYDGELVMAPPVGTGHQDVVGNLHLLLRAACPPGLRISLGPGGWRATRYRLFEPDLFVAPREHFSPKLLEHPPLLCVEVLSPSTRRYDMVRKRTAYESAGVPSYWIVDPAQPSILVLELEAGRYVEVADTTERIELTRPFPVTVDPARLLD